MALVRGLINLKQQSRGCVAAIGNFDGVHLGHQAIIERVTSQAKSLGVASWVLLFEPHPKEFFLADKCPARLSCFKEKYDQLKALDVDNLLVLQFNARLRNMLAKDFVKQILINTLKVKHLVVGDDFHFGYQRKGNFQLLETMAVEQYTLEPTPSVNINGERVSSTLVRDLLIKNNFEKVRDLLNRRFSITGKVGYGQKLGRKIDFPTANVALKRKKSPLKGVFLVKCYWLKNGKTENAWGVANCGTRPTVNGDNERLEVHLLAVSESLYGIELSVEFFHWIRNEQKFADLESLKIQIQQDVSMAKELIANY